MSYAPFSSKNSIRLFFTQIQSLYTFLLLLSVNQLRRVNAVENLSEPCRLKVITFIKSMNVTKRIYFHNAEMLVNAAHIDFLIESVKTKLGEASIDTAD